MNPKRKQAITLLDEAAKSVNDVKVKTNVRSLGELTEAFINTPDKAERRKIAADYKKQHTELQNFIDANPDLEQHPVRKEIPCGI